MRKGLFRRAPAAWWLSAAVVGGAVLAWWLGDDGQAMAEASATAAPRPPAATAGASAAPAASSAQAQALAQQARQRELHLWRQRLEQAQQTLQAYQAATRYPHEARPLSEQPDQAYPNRPIEEEKPLRLANNKAAQGVRLRTSQDRVFVQGDESVHLSVSLRGDDGTAQPLRVLRSTVREIPPPNTGSLYPAVGLNFNDEGLDGDQLPRDGVHGVRLQPSLQGFAGLAGTLRVETVLQYGGQEVPVYFDLVVSGAAPAVWSGSPREVQQDGSLVFLLGANVKEPGRYVVTGRVDDAMGRPLALLTFNDEVGSGAQTFRLSLFGKLVRDAKPAFPLTLRDVEGFMLRPGVFPDRALMARRAGRVLVTRAYALESFSDKEWSGEERRRYLAELQRDVDDAGSRVSQLDSAR